MPSSFALQYLFSLISAITKPASLLTISGATPNKTPEATAVGRQGFEVRVWHQHLCV
jgi:hypothetical protein